jgi:hypothetical protein
MNKFLLGFVAIFTITSAIGQDYKFGKVSIEELKEKSHQVDPEANGAILYRSYRTIFKYNNDVGFYAVTEVKEKIKIYTKEGLDLANIEVPLYIGNGSKDKLSNLKAFTYNLENESVVKTKLTNDGIFNNEVSEFLEVRKFVFPKVKEGSVLEYEYTVSTPFIGNLDPYYFQELIPVDKVVVTFWAPEYMKFKLHRKGWYPFRIEEEEKRDFIEYKYLSNRTNTSTGVRKGTTLTDRLEFQSTVYKISLSDVEPIIPEPFVSNLSNFRSGLQFELNYTKFPNSPLEMYSTSWSEVVKNIYGSKHFGEQLDNKRLFKKLLPNMTSLESSDAQKITDIYGYVRNNFAWNDNYQIYTSDDLSKLIKEKSGNCSDINLLLVGLLRAAGLEANPILISSKRNGIPIFPSRTGFDYVVAGIGQSSYPFILDAANKSSAPQLLDKQLLNWNGKLIKDDGTFIDVNLSPKNTANHTALIDITFDNDLQVAGDSKARFTGHLAQEIRQKYFEQSKTDQIKIVQSQFGNLEVDELSFKDLENVMKPLTVNYSFSDESIAEEITGKIYINPLAHVAIKNNLFVAESRKYPIDFEYPKEERFIVSWQLPEGYKVESLPEHLEVNLKNGLASYKYDIQEMGDIVKVSVLRTLNRSLVGADSYQDLQAYFKMIVEKEAEKIVLKKI